MHQKPFRDCWIQYLRKKWGIEVCYLDDIVVVSEEFSEHLKVLRNIFQKLRPAALKINQQKSQFCRSELKYLGHVVTTAGIAMDPDKVSTRVNYPAPRNVKELKSFLGLVSWYQKYVPNCRLRYLSDGIIEKEPKLELVRRMSKCSG
jgi:hypothetical protein